MTANGKKARYPCSIYKKAFSSQSSVEMNFLGDGG